MLYFQTDTNTFAYAYRVSADFAEEMEAEYRDAISSLELTEIEGVENTETLSLKGEDYDPSAEGESPEMFISYFDSWYQYGDLNAMNIRLYGEGNLGNLQQPRIVIKQGDIFLTAVLLPHLAQLPQIVNDSESMWQMLLLMEMAI